MARPPEYLFTHEIKQQAKERAGYRCERCGKQVDYLEVHHRVAVWFALEVPALTHAVIASLSNAEVCCRACHVKQHLEESRAYYAEVAAQVLKEYLEATIRPERDDWRKKLKQYPLVGDD